LTIPNVINTCFNEESFRLNRESTLAGLVNQLTRHVTKLKGTMARLTMKIPSSGQHLLARKLGFDQNLVQLDPHLQMLAVIRGLISSQSLLSDDPVKSRLHFSQEMSSIMSKPTPVESVKDWRIPSNQALLPVRHYIPKLNNSNLSNENTLPLLVFFHGGGFVVGDLDTHDEACRLLCQHAQVQVLSIAYRLAPEHPAPTAVYDCLEGLKWAFAHAEELHVDSTKITIGGDSAGGNIAAVISQLTVGTPYAPSAQLLIYPGVDSKNSYPSSSLYGRGLFLNQYDKDYARQYYIKTSALSLSDPLVSPLFGNLVGLPPALLVTAELDILLDEGELYAEKLREAGTHCVAYRALGQGHGFINITSINRAALNATIKMAHDFRALLDEIGN
jgi:acetyl esterase